MSGPALFLMAFGSVLAVTGIVLFVFFTWFKENAGGQNRVQFLHVAFDISHPALVIFIVGCGLIVVPFFWPKPAFESGDIAPASSSEQSFLSQQGATLPAATSTSSGPLEIATPRPSVSPTESWVLSVEPPIARSPLATEHLIIVTLRDLDGFPLVGQKLHLQITSGPHAGITMEGETDQRGQGFLEYTGQNAGTDRIRVWTGAETYEAAPTRAKSEVTNEWF